VSGLRTGIVCLALLLAAPIAAGAEDGTSSKDVETAKAKAPPSALELELNRIQPLDDACRLYLLFRNGGETPYSRFVLDLVFFDREAVIDRRFSVEAGPLPADKTTLKQLDVPELECGSLGGLLLNTVSTCEGASGDAGACLRALDLQNRTTVRFFK